MRLKKKKSRLALFPPISAAAYGPLSRKVRAVKIALLARGVLLLQSILQGGAANFHKFACRFFAAIF